MTARGCFLTIASLIALFAASAHACMWDADTLRDERRGLPGIAEILAGRWERHSPFFYEDRVRRMNEVLAREPNYLEAWDNLAVAYEKLGQIDKAIDTIHAKDKLKRGEYTTHANLGTFYLHSGRLDEGIVEIEKALAINPNAHFGREKYQLQLAKYLRDRKNGDKGSNRSGPTFISPPRFEPPHRTSTTSPSDRAAIRAEFNSPEYRAKIAEAQSAQNAWMADREHAIEGVVGMIRFGTGKSPDLYAALGELLASRRDAHLAYRAFLRARDLGFSDPAWASEQMGQVSEMTEDKSEFEVELINRERADADAWVVAYQAFEDDLIRAGKDHADESLFAPFYAKHGTARQSLEPTITGRVAAATRSPYAAVPLILTGGLCIALGLPLVVRRLIHRFRPAKTSE